MFTAACYLPDSTVFASALAVAANPAATTEARVVGLLIASVQVTPRAAVDRAALLGAEPDDPLRCRLGWCSTPPTPESDGAAAPLRRAAPCASRVAETVAPR